MWFSVWTFFAAGGAGGAAEDLALLAGLSSAVRKVLMRARRTTRNNFFIKPPFAELVAAKIIARRSNLLLRRLSLGRRIFGGLRAWQIGHGRGSQDHHLRPAFTSAGQEQHLVGWIVGQAVAFHAGGQLVIDQAMLQIDGQHRPVARGSVEEVARGIEDQRTRASGRGDAKQFGAAIGIEREHGKAHGNIQAAMGAIERQSGWLRGGQLEAADDLPGSVESNYLARVLQTHQQAVTRAILDHILWERVELNDAGFRSSDGIYDADGSVEGTAGVKRLGVRYPQQPFRTVRHRNQLFDLPVLTVDYGDALAACQGDKDFAAGVVRGDASRIVNLRDPGDQSPFHRAEYFDGVGCGAGDDHLSVGHRHLIEPRVAGKVDDPHLAQLGN